MYLARTFDADGINRIIHDPAISDLLCDDHTQDYCVQECESQCWIGVYDDTGRLDGAFLLLPVNSVTVDIHTCLLPVIHGKPAIEAGQLLLQIIFGQFKKAITSVPANNRRAALFAAKLGFQNEGINRKSFLKNGELLDQKLMGLTHEEYICQLQQR